MTNEYLNKFALEKLTNIWTNEYICLNIFEYIRIFEYSSNTAVHTEQGNWICGLGRYLMGSTTQGIKARGYRRGDTGQCIQAMGYRTGDTGQRIQAREFEYWAKS